MKNLTISVTHTHTHAYKPSYSQIPLFQKLVPGNFNNLEQVLENYSTYKANPAHHLFL